MVEGLERALVAVGAVHAERRQQLEHLLLHRRVRRVQGWKCNRFGLLTLQLPTIDGVIESPVSEIHPDIEVALFREMTIRARVRVAVAGADVKTDVTENRRWSCHSFQRQIWKPTWLTSLTPYPNWHLLKNQPVSQTLIIAVCMRRMSGGAGLPSRQEMRRMGRGPKWDGCSVNYSLCQTELEPRNVMQPCGEIVEEKRTFPLYQKIRISSYTLPSPRNPLPWMSRDTTSSPERKGERKKEQSGSTFFLPPPPRRSQSIFHAHAHVQQARWVWVPIHQISTVTAPGANNRFLIRMHVTRHCIFAHTLRCV